MKEVFSIANQVLVTSPMLSILSSSFEDDTM